MRGRFAKVHIAGGMIALCLLFAVDGAVAGNRMPPDAPASLGKFSQSKDARASTVMAIAQANTDETAATGPSCEEQQKELDTILAKGPAGSGPDELRSFSKTVTCERLGPLVVAAIDRFNADINGTAGPAANSPELVRATQVELNRLGCFDGKINGSLTTTRDALARYMSSGGGTVASPDITSALLADLTGHADRVCPMACASGEIARGGTCLIEVSRTDPATLLSPETPPKSMPERHAGPTEASREPATKPKTTAGLPRTQPGSHAGSPRTNSVYGLGF